MTSQTLSACHRCHAARYCSKPCQAEAWPRHKKEVCDKVNSWIAAVTLQGLTHLGGCSDAEIATARGQYPACTDIAFVAFHKFQAPNGNIMIARYHMHTAGSPPCAEKGVIHCATTPTRTGHITAMQEIPLGR